jgi:hypothetical protein
LHIGTASTRPGPDPLSLFIFWLSSVNNSQRASFSCHSTGPQLTC